MDLTTVYSKTAKGVQALTQKGKRLPTKLARALSLVDGRATLEEILEKAGELPTSTLPQTLADLAKDGYIKIVAREPLTRFSISPDSPASMVVSETVDETFFKVLAETEARKQLMKEAAENPQEARKKAQEEAAAIAEIEAMRQKIEARKAAEIEERSRREAVQRKIAEAMAQEEAALKARKEADIRAYQEKIAQLEKEKAAAEEQVRQEALERVAKEAAELKAQEEAEERARQEAEQQRIAEAKARDEAEQKARKDAEEQALREKENAEAEERARQEAEKKAAQEAEIRATAERKAREEAEEAEIQARREKAEKEKAEAEERLRKELEERVAKEARIRKKAERKAQEEAAAKARAEVSKQLRMEARAREEAERKKKRAQEKAKQEAEEQARAEARRQLRLEARAREEAELKKAREEAEARARAEAEEQKRLEAEAEERARRETEENARAEEEARRQAEVAAQAQEEAERKAREIEEARVKREAEVRAIVEAEERERAEEAARIKAEADVKAREEAEIKARKEAEAKAKAEAEERAHREAEEKIRAQEEAQEKSRAEAERKAREEAEQEARERAEIEARARALADARAEEAEKARQKTLAIPRKFKRPAKLGKMVLISLAALILLPAVLLQVMSLNVFIPPIEKLASDRMDEPVSIHSMRASLWPAPHLRLDGITIGKLRDIKIPTVRVMPELAAFFEKTKIIKAIEVESLTVDQDDLARILAWVGPGGDTEKIQVRRIAIRAATIEMKRIPLPPLEADVVLAATGKFKQANLRSADKKIEVAITPKTGGFEVDIVANDWQPPIWPNLTFTELHAKAMATSAGMRISEIEGRLYSGKATGSATIKWGDTWSAEGELNIENVVLAGAMPALTNDIELSGKLDAKTVYSMQSGDLDSLFDNPRIKASFNISDGTINNIDLARAIQPRATETTGGKTLFTSLSGSMSLDKMRYQYRQMKLAAGLLSASGEADIMPDKQLSGKTSVEMKLPSSTIHARLTLSGDLKQPVLRR